VLLPRPKSRSAGTCARGNRPQIHQRPGGCTAVVRRYLLTVAVGQHTCAVGGSKSHAGLGRLYLRRTERWQGANNGAGFHAEVAESVESFSPAVCRWPFDVAGGSGRDQPVSRAGIGSRVSVPGRTGPGCRSPGRIQSCRCMFPKRHGAARSLVPRFALVTACFVAISRRGKTAGGKLESSVNTWSIGS